VKTASYFLGTWRDEDGTTYRLLRGVGPYESGRERRHLFTSRGGAMLEHAPEEDRLFGGTVRTSCLDGVVRFDGVGGGFHYGWAGDEVHWSEGDVADLRGTALRPATQWLNPWRSGGAYVIASKYRMSGTILGRPLVGFAAHEIHYFPPGRSFFDSPLGWGGREHTWGHMVTEHDDGTYVVASLALGADGWGFALLWDEAGELHATTELDVSATVRPSGYPEEVRYRFSGQDWVWRAAPDGERAATVGGGIVGAEGVLRRAGDDRRVVRAMGTLDWWLDGRAAHLVTS
jgi:hypothetical protein